MVGLGAVSLAACEPTANHEDEAALESTGTVYHLTREERTALEQKAIAGDADAAVRLAEFYEYSGGEADHNLDMEQAIRWLRLADSLGHPDAKHDLEWLLAAQACTRTTGMPDTSAERKAAHRMRKAAQGVACDRPWLREIEAD